MNAETRSLATGDSVSLEDGPLTSDRIATFARFGADDSPSHLDDAEARRIGYPRALAHGILSMALAGRLFHQALPDAQLIRFQSRFVAMTFHNDVLRCHATVRERTGDLVLLDVLIHNQDDKIVMTGWAELRCSS